MVKGGSKHSIEEATRSRADFSRHDNAKGAAGFISPLDESQPADFLSKPGQTAIVNPSKDGIKNFEIGVAWDETGAEEIQPQSKPGLFQKLMGKAEKIVQSRAIDLDVGCLYQLSNGQRGCIQAFGKRFGNLEKAPFIQLSGDERTGEAEGEDEVITINGQKWNEIKKVLIYLYIYEGAENWKRVQPQIQVRVPEEKPMIVSLHARRNDLPLCAVASLENIRGGIKMTNHLEYYPGHAAMDRAFGYGLEWEDGEKS